MKGSRLALAAPVLCALAACAPAATAPARRGQTPAPRGIVDARAGADALAVPVLCGEGRAELCNGIDDDCDGALDEGCESGAESPFLHVTLAWSGPASLGLRVEAAVAGAEATALSGEDALQPRVLDAAATGCDGVDARPPYRVSSLWFDERRTPRTQWRVSVAHRDPCAEDPAPVPAAVTVAGPAQVAGTWNTVVAPGAVAEAVRFTLR